MTRADSTLTTVAPLARWEVADLVTTWFRRLTDKAAPPEMVRMLDPAGPTLVFPEGTFTGEDGFRTWYDAVTSRFFDQTHELRTVDIESRADGAEVRLTVDWQARTWLPPAANSEWTGATARQHWSVRRADDRPVITEYRVLSLEPMTGGVRRLP